ncbi:MAG: BFD (2Fe-2S)-binding domain-containing [Planctomycetota bacterium]|nr:MAG: BFD (2Fe-2S)-binding domain-containing [Planctomycetota bacterium]
MSEPDLLVVGGGPAGMSAAIAASRRGLRCTIVDEGFDLGGQIYRPPTSPLRAPEPHPRGEGLRNEVRALADRIEVRKGSAVWGIFEGLRVAVGVEDRTELFKPRAVLLATGAYEFVPPFPGWTLPGVMTPGAAQILVKTMGVAPGKRVVVAGTGPFLLVVACQLLNAGVKVVAVLEASRRAPWLALPFHGFRSPGLLLDGLGYLAKLAFAGVPVRYGRMVVSAAGDESVRSVTHAPVDRDWFPDRSKSEAEEADTLCVGYGFVPRAELAQMAGCALEMRPDVGGWVPARDRDLRTTVPGIFAAGDGSGVAGALVAELEGRLAGIAAAVSLGALDRAEFNRVRRPIDRQLARLIPMRRALDRISAIQPGLSSLVDDRTTVCRCEEVAWSEVRDSIRAGSSTYPTVKVSTRVGMGACQGRFCWPSVARLVAGELKCPLADVGQGSARPPLRPITLGALATSPREG